MNTLTELLGQTVHGSDGSLGTVSDLWLDDASWSPRFLVVSPGLLASPLVVPVCRLQRAGLLSDLRSEDLRTDVAEDRGQVDPTAGFRVRAFAGWSGYWGGPGSLGTGPAAGTGALPALAFTPKLGPVHEEDEEPELLSLQRLRGAPVVADTSQFGHLADVVLGPDWSSVAILVDTGALLPGEKVAVPIHDVLSAGIESRVVMVRPEALERAS